jgi:hypothetical protein
MILTEELIEKVASNDPSLKEISLRDDKNVPGKLFDKLLRALADNKHITSLKFVECGITDEYVFDKITTLLMGNKKNKSNITLIDLSYNEISDAGAAHLAEVLKCNSTLQSLDLSGNKIHDEGAEQLAEALEHNNTLKSLFLKNTQIVDAAIKFTVRASRLKDLILPTIQKGSNATTSIESIYFAKGALQRDWDLDEAAREIVDQVAAPMVISFTAAETALRLIEAAEAHVKKTGDLKSFEGYNQLNLECVELRGGGLIEEDELSHVKSCIQTNKKYNQLAYLALSETLTPVIKYRLEFPGEEWSIKTDGWSLKNIPANCILLDTVINLVSLKLQDSGGWETWLIEKIMRQKIATGVNLVFTSGRFLKEGSINVIRPNADLRTFDSIADDPHSYLSTLGRDTRDIMRELLKHSPAATSAKAVPMNMNKAHDAAASSPPTSTQAATDRHTSPPKKGKQQESEMEEKPRGPRR